MLFVVSERRGSEANLFDRHPGHKTRMQYFMLQCSPLICVLLQFVQSTYDLSRRKNGQTAKNMKTTIKNTRSFPWTCWPNYFVYRRSGTICKNWKTLMKIAQNQSRNCSNGLFFCKFLSQHFRGLRFGFIAGFSVGARADTPLQNNACEPA